MTAPLEDSRWFYCMLCDTPSYAFTCCENWSCTGGGCDQCADRDEVYRRIDAGEYPKPLPKVEDGLTVLLRKMRKKKKP